MPRGIDTYKGLGLPNQGNVNLKQSSESTGDVFTITMSSRGGGNFLVMRNAPSTVAGGAGLDSTSLTQDQIRFTTLSALQWTSNSSVVQTISTAGIVGGAESTAQAWVIDSSGRFNGLKRAISTQTTAANFTVATSQSGTLFIIGDNNGTSQLALLPVNPPAGVYYDFLVSTQTGVDGFSIHTTADSSAQLILPGLTSVASTIGAIQPGSVRAHGVRVTAFSSVNWFCEPLGQIANAETTLANAVLELNWTTATTLA